MVKKNCTFLPLQFIFVLIVHTSLVCTKAEQKSVPTRPRGVSPQLAPLYQERAQFECLDGKKSIPFEQVNDDYCDCADGSDEPGTSACKNGHFYCANFGFRPQTVPSSRVNDFICDCCDGSDEWDSGTECPNLCDSLGAKAREEAKQQAEVQTAGYAKRKELAKEGAKMLAEKKLEVEKKQKELDELAELKKGVEEAKKEAEEMEKEAKDREEKEWEEAKKEQRAAKARQMFDKMEKDGDGRISSDELKRFVMQNSEGATAERGDELLKDIFREEKKSAEGTESEGPQMESLDFDAFLDKFETVTEFVDKIVSETEKDAQIPADDGESDKTADEDEKQREKYEQRTRELIERADQARREYDEVVDKVSDLERAIRESNSYSDVEFGTDSAWAPLKGQCAELTTSQYVYKLCMFDHTVQKERNGHAEISLGHWGKWAGPENGNKFEAQRYEHGQTCWNGPERSTLVQFECGEQLQLVDVSEPSKCEYHFLAKSPTACADPEELKGEHAEL